MLGKVVTMSPSAFWQMYKRVEPILRSLRRGTALVRNATDTTRSFLRSLPVCDTACASGGFRAATCCIKDITLCFHCKFHQFHLPSLISASFELEKSVSHPAR